ncbi:MAG: arsenate reductase ArsC [Micrococcales bacterium]|nr:arsenate reductase ArsC [Micrococcales bacterium]
MGTQENFLASSADSLSREFSGIFGRETVDRFLHSSYARLSESATVTTHLPILTEKFARQRLRALSRVDGQGYAGLPTVLFLCVHNAGRSQMALGFFQHYAGEAAIGWSGGSEPGDQVSPVAVEVMAERGIDISGEYPKPWTDEVVQAADVVISMGCGDACPVVPGKRYQEWTLPDPAAWTVDEVRPVRDEVERRVLALLGELEVRVSAAS